MSHIKNHKFDYAVDEPVLHTNRRITPKFLVMHYTAGFTASSAINAYKNRRVSAHLTYAVPARSLQRCGVARWPVPSHGLQWLE